MLPETFYAGALVIAPVLGEAWRRAWLSGSGGVPADRVARVARGLSGLSLAVLVAAVGLGCGFGERPSSAALAQRSGLALMLIFWAEAGINLSLLSMQEAYGKTSSPLSARLLHALRMALVPVVCLGFMLVLQNGPDMLPAGYAAVVPWVLLAVLILFWRRGGQYVPLQVAASGGGERHPLVEGPLLARIREMALAGNIEVDAVVVFASPERAVTSVPMGTRTLGLSEACAALPVEDAAALAAQGLATMTMSAGMMRTMLPTLLKTILGAAVVGVVALGLLRGSGYKAWVDQGEYVVAGLTLVLMLAVSRRQMRAWMATVRTLSARLYGDPHTCLEVLTRITVLNQAGSPLGAAQWAHLRAFGGDVGLSESEAQGAIERGIGHSPVDA